MTRQIVGWKGAEKTLQQFGGAGCLETPEVFPNEMEHVQMTLGCIVQVLLYSQGGY